MKTKKALKGFTLIELIVVVAIFGMIMAAAYAIIGPVRNLYNSTYSYTDSVAVVDNVAMYLESNLRYCNRIDICDNANIANETGFRNAKVDEFIARYHLKDTARISNVVKDEFIYLLKIDNPDPADPAVPVDLDAPSLALTDRESGKISVWKYSVKNSAWVDADFKEWAVNRQFYDEYTFTSAIRNTQDRLGADSLDFTLNVNLFHNDRRYGEISEIRNTNLDNVVAFPLINVVDTNGIIQEPIIIKNAAGDTEALPSVNRYFYRDTYTSADPSDAFVSAGADIYIMFTQCPKIENE